MDVHGWGLRIALKSLMHTGQSPKECDRTNYHIKIHVARSLLREPREVTTSNYVISFSVSKCQWMLRSTYLWYRKPQLSYLNFTDKRNGDPIGKHQIVWYYIQNDRIWQTTIRWVVKRTNQLSGISILVIALTANLPQTWYNTPFTRSELSNFSKTTFKTVIQYFSGNMAMGYIYSWEVQLRTQGNILATFHNILNNVSYVPVWLHHWFNIN